MDIFYRTAAYEFGSSFFKVRGLDSDNATVQINGIKMNKLYLNITTKTHKKFSYFSHQHLVIVMNIISFINQFHL